MAIQTDIMNPSTRRKALHTMVVLAVASLAVTGCRSSSPIVNHWIHSHEEDSASSRVYRPSSYDFPLSRGREQWDLRADRSAVHYAIAPADGHEKRVGTWAYSDGKQLSITLSTGNYYYEVEHVDSTRLVMRVLQDTLAP